MNNPEFVQTRPTSGVTEAEHFLRRQPVSPAGKKLFVAAPTTLLPFSEPIDVGPTWTTIRPRPLNKVVGDGPKVRYENEALVNQATWIWPVSVFWAIGGGPSTAMSLDSGVCVHPVKPGTRLPADPANNSPDYIATLMASWDHWWHINGKVWVVDADQWGFKQHPELRWLWTTDQTIVVPTNEGVAVSKLDLPVTPVDCAVSPHMESAGARRVGEMTTVWEKGRRLRKPLRGPHEPPFNEDFACGATGGQFYVHNFGLIETINDHFVPYEDRILNPNTLRRQSGMSAREIARSLAGT